MELTTERLLLKEVSLADAPFFLNLFNTEAWLKYIGDKNVHTLPEAEKYIKKNYLPSYETHKHGSYIVSLKETGENLGSCGLYKREQLEHPDIGFAFLPQYMGKGYGYEAASAVMEYAKNELGYDVILGFTVAYNKASIALLKKLGLHEHGTFNLADDPEELLLFSTQDPL